MESLFSPVASSSHAPLKAPDSPSAPAGPITDFALLESQKENIKPLASGRSAATLSSLFVAEKEEVDKAVMEGHEKHRKEIEEAERRDREGEDMVEGIQDVLDAHHRYILFTVQHYPSSITHILPLLESTTRRFIPDARYTQDVRYLKLWVMYTRYVERREEIWGFLEAKDIGTRHSVFYEEWAAAAEGLGRFVPLRDPELTSRKKAADNIYRLGINRSAAPLERLQMRYKAFLQRTLAAGAASIPEDEDLPVRTPGRAVLGTVSTSARSTQQAPRAIKNNGAKLAVFSDDQAGPSAPSEPSDWAELGTRDDRRKENNIEAGPWKGETLPQSAARSRVAPRTPKVEVFQDSGDTGHVLQAEQVFARNKLPMTDAELLRLDPLRNYDTTGVATAAFPTTASLPPPPQPRKKPPKVTKQSTAFVKEPWEVPAGGREVQSSSGKMERRMFDWDEVYRNGDEWSFEEVRARKTGLLGKTWRGNVADWEREWHRPGASTPKPVKVASRASPTVNTKLADQDVYGMFNQTIGGDRRDFSEESSDDDGDDDDSEEDSFVGQPMPTPLPSGSLRMAPASSIVPPTPTPMPGARTAPLKMQVFSNENDVPPTPRTVLGTTPARTPLASRTPLSSRTPLGAPKPQAFAVLEEEREEDVETEASSSRLPLNAFATPIVSEKMQPAKRAAFRELAQPASDAPGPFDEIAEEDEDEMPRRRRFNIHEMTPITERTCEYTSLRSSQTTTGHFGTASVSSTGFSQLKVFEDGETGPGTPPADVDDLAKNLHLTPVTEADENDDSERQIQLNPFDPSSSQGSIRDTVDQSNRSDSPFNVSQGYTIDNHTGATGMAAATMVLEDLHFESRAEQEAETPVAAVQQSTSAIAALPNPCNAGDEDIRAMLVDAAEPPLSSLAHFRDLRTTKSDRLQGLQKTVKIKQRRSSATSRSAVDDKPAIIKLDKDAFEINSKIGEGGFGAVFLMTDIAARDRMLDASEDSDNEDEDDANLNDCLVAIKIESPVNVWETLVLDRIWSRLPDVLKPSIVKPKASYAYEDESFLVLEYASQGTLLDVVNAAVKNRISDGTPAVEEGVAAFFVVELLKVVEGLHTAGFLHGDLKIDNCLVRLESLPRVGPGSQWAEQYDATGANGWSAKGVRLIDFGRAIDMSMYPAGRDQTFVADWPTDARDCVEIREARPWSYQADYFGLASIAYCLLFGKYITTEVASNSPHGKRYKIGSQLKRYWQTDLWNKLFDLLLNPLMAGTGPFPVTKDLAAIREEFEAWLEGKKEGVKAPQHLKKSLKKIEFIGEERLRQVSST